MNYLLDLAVLAIIGICVFLGYKKGFVKTILGAASTLIALLLAVMFCFPVGKVIGDAVIKPAVKSVVIKEIDKAVGSKTSEFNENDINKELKNPGKDLKDILGKFGLKPDKYIDDMKNQGGLTANEYKEKLVDRMVSPYTDSVGAAVAFVLLFIIFKIAVSILAKVLNIIAKLPLINMFNKSGGIILGAVNALIMILIFCFFVRHTLDVFNLFTESDIKNSFIFQLFYFIKI